MRPIHCACKKGYIETVKYLLSANCDIEAENEVRYVRKPNCIYFYSSVGKMETDSFCL